MSIINPIAENPEKSELSISFEEVARIPNSGFNNQPPRLNFILSPNDDSGRLFTNDMRGKLHIIDDGNVTEYLDLRQIIGTTKWRNVSNQQGFLSFVFDPDFKNNGIFYTVHTETKLNNSPADFQVTKPIINSQGNIIGSSHHDVISKWVATDPTANVFSGTRSEILRVEQPYADHNFGQLAFNPNAEPGSSDYGMLYISTGDGGSDGFPVSNTDPQNNGQDLSVVFGKILRINTNGNNSSNGKYGIPEDNPFVSDDNSSTLGEIWAYGLRNPHRFSWDTGGDHKLLIADIGQSFIEEVNLGIKGANYGWGNREGTFVTDENNQYSISPLPDDDALFGYTYPVANYDHDISGNVAIAGGYVYRGSAIPELVGQYIFADFANDGRFFHVSADNLINGQQATLSELRIYDNEEETSFLEILDRNRSDVRFGVDQTGELYVINKQDGIVRKIVNNDTPLTNNPIANQIIGEGQLFSFMIPNNTFTENDTGFTYSLLDGVILPSGINFDNSSGTFNGNPLSTTAGTYKITIVGTDSTAIIRKDSFILTILDFIGDASDNNLTGTINNDQLQGLAGNDSLSGLDANDTLIGDEGNDTLNGGLGNDSLVGGIGNDLYIIDNSRDKIKENFNEGIDTVNSSFSYGLKDNLENLNLGGIENLYGTGNHLNNELNGNSGNNKLNGGFGVDILKGGLGNDNYIVDNLLDMIIENLSEGIDRVNTSVNYILSNDVENLTLMGIDNIEGKGNVLNNVIVGNNGDNKLIGDNGDDNLRGGLGNDVFLGEMGSDTLSGGDGDDLLIGGIDNDRLRGGIGVDYFSFSEVDNFSSLGVDMITDFTKGDDKIVLSQSVFNFLSNSLSINDLDIIRTYNSITEINLVGSSNSLVVYNSANGKLFYNPDRENLGLNDGGHFATLSNKPSLLDVNDFTINVN
jgi:Ca2+-binding RTX toxin-like protein